MPAATLVISGPDRTSEFPLAASGVIIGRSSKCDVVLDSLLVSRQHARIFQDPFGRWIIEALGSRTCVMVGGQRVRAQALLPGEKVVVGPFTLSLLQACGEDASPQATTSTVVTRADDRANVQIIRAESAAPAVLSRDRLRELNHIIDRLDASASLQDLYDEACRCLAATRETAAVLVRLPEAAKPLPASVPLMACSVGGEAVAVASADAANLYLSRRVLEAVRSSNQAVMAKSVPSDDAPMMLTVVDRQSPRVVCCAPVGASPGSVEALYLDMLMGHASDDTFDFVRAVAGHVRLVRKNLLLVEAKAQRTALERELSVARGIQSKLTPTAIADVPGVDVAVYYEPAMWVGGDYCDLWVLPDGRLAFAVGDVSGKGLPAAMVMSNLHAALRTAAQFCPGPSAVMDLVNRHFGQHMPEEMFVTMVLGVLDPKTGRLEYVNAGHIPPLVVRPDRRVAPLGRPTNPMLGMFDRPFASDVETVAPGTGLVVVTDGITEARAPNGVEFGLGKVEELLRSATADSAQQMVQAVKDAAVSYRGLAPQQDDATVLALRWRGPAG